MNLQTLDRKVDEALASGDEQILRSAFYDLACEREARVASAANDDDVRDVEQLASLQHRLADEVSRLREDNTEARVAHAKALPEVKLLPDTRKKRPVSVWEPRLYVRRR